MSLDCVLQCIVIFLHLFSFFSFFSFQTTSSDDTIVISGILGAVSSILALLVGLLTAVIRLVRSDPNVNMSRLEHSMRRWLRQPTRLDTSHYQPEIRPLRRPFSETLRRLYRFCVNREVQRDDEESQETVAMRVQHSSLSGIDLTPNTVISAPITTTTTAAATTSAMTTAAVIHRSSSTPNLQEPYYIEPLPSMAGVSPIGLPEGVGLRELKRVPYIDDEKSDDERPLSQEPEPDFPSIAEVEDEKEIIEGEEHFQKPSSEFVKEEESQAGARGAYPKRERKKPARFS